VKLKSNITHFLKYNSPHKEELILYMQRNNETKIEETKKENEIRKTKRKESEMDRNHTDICKFYFKQFSIR